MREFEKSAIREEAVEVAQRATKALRFGLSEVQEGHDADNAHRLLKELNDLAAVVEMLGAEGHLPQWSARAEHAHRQAKKERVEHYLKLSDRHGRLTGDPV